MSDLTETAAPQVIADCDNNHGGNNDEDNMSNTNISDSELSLEEDESRNEGRAVALGLLSESAIAALRDLGLLRERESDETGICKDKPISIHSRNPDIRSDTMSNSEFKKQEYWESRFEKEESYDWLANFSSVKKYILPQLQRTDKILIVGCGNSSFSSELFLEGFENIINIDYSATVINAMSSIHSDSKPSMLWVHMDMLKLDFPPETFDVVIDKAAMDAIMVDEGDVWNPTPACIEAAHSMCAGITSVLKPHGKYLQISFAQPHFRTKYLSGHRYLNQAAEDHYSSISGYSEVYNWNLSTISIDDSGGGCLNSFLYIMEK